MKNRLERFVEDNRDAFDELEPRSDLWLDISLKVLDKEEVSRPIWFRQTFWRYAAAVIILLSIGLGVFQLGRYTQRMESVVMEPATLQQIAPELAQVEAYYTSLISEQRQQLNDADLKNLNADMAGDFSRDLSSLDSAYVRLKRDLYKGANKEQIVSAMIQNLQLRSEIISRQIETLGKIKNIREDNRKDEKVSI
jgi:hypothetical protein